MPHRQGIHQNHVRVHVGQLLVGRVGVAVAVDFTTVGVAVTFGWVVVATGVVDVATGVVDTDLAEITGALMVGAWVVASGGRVT